MSNHRYQLEKYTGSKSRHTCPYCGEKKVFSRYVDKENNNAYIADNVGRCDREANCCAHYKPKQYFEDNNIEAPKSERQQRERTAPPPPKPKVNIPIEYVSASMKRQCNNKFIEFLNTLFEPCVVSDLISLYKIGSSNGARWWSGGDDGCSVIFWFINKSGFVRAGQVKLFNSNGHTVKYVDKEGTDKVCTEWAHTLLQRAHKYNNTTPPAWLERYPSQEMYIDCFFGEHLLCLPTHSTRPVAVVEAPKTAIIASVFFPDFVWLACGALSYLKEKRCEALKGKKVVLFPDLGRIINDPKDVANNGWDTSKGVAFNKWQQAAQELQHIADFTVSDILEQRATPESRVSGLDLCDYLVSDEVRRELIEGFKAALIAAPDDTNSTHVGIWLEYCSKGLRRADKQQAYRELVEAGIFEAVQDTEINPHHYSIEAQ